jgi:hypothetical protein
VLAALVLGGSVPAMSSPGGAECTAAEKADAEHALTTYRKRMGADRKAYFRTHKKAAQRKAFLKRQQARLRALQRAASCTVRLPPPPPLPPAPSVLELGPSLAPDDADRVRQGSAIAEAYFKKLGVPDTWRYQLFADGDLETVVAAWVRNGTDEATARRILSGGGALASGTHVYIWTGASGWRASEHPRRVETAVHELFHTAQNLLLGSFADNGPPDRVSPYGPTWLREGSADFVGFSAVADAGVAPWPALRADMIRLMKQQSPGVSLQAVATQGGAAQNGYAAYSVGFTAVDYLAQQKGPASIVEFYRQVGQGKTWQAAFESVFGRSIDAFYAEFEQYRQTL